MVVCFHLPAPPAARLNLAPLRRVRARSAPGGRRPSGEFERDPAAGARRSHEELHLDRHAGSAVFDVDYAGIIQVAIPESCPDSLKAAPAELSIIIHTCR
jgi:hypothetical protein